MRNFLRGLVPAIFGVAMAGLAAPAAAQGFSVGANVSTLGIGAEAGYRFAGLVGVRLGGNYLSYDYSDNIGGIDYSADLTLQSLGAIVDLYPFAGGFRLSGGFRLNGTEMDFRATPTVPVIIGGTLQAAGTIIGNLDFNPVAPYVGLGYVGNLAAGLQLALDVGVLFQGKPDVTLRSTNPAVSAADLQREAADIENDLDILRYYPVVMISLIYQF